MADKTPRLENTEGWPGQPYLRTDSRLNEAARLWRRHLNDGNHEAAGSVLEQAAYLKPESKVDEGRQMDLFDDA